MNLTCTYHNFERDFKGTLYFHVYFLCGKFVQIITLMVP